MRDREDFERDLDRAIGLAARARRGFQELPAEAPRSDRLKAAVALAEAVKSLMALREETGARLGALRCRDRSRRAYAQAANLQTRNRGDRP